MFPEHFDLYVTYHLHRRPNVLDSRHSSTPSVQYAPGAWTWVWAPCFVDYMLYLFCHLKLILWSWCKWSLVYTPSLEYLHSQLLNFFSASQCVYLCVSICLLLCLPVDVCGYHEKNAPCVPHAHRAVISLFLVLHSRPWFQFLPLVPYLFSSLYVLSSRVNASLVSSTFSSLNLPLLLVSCLLWFTYFTVSISLHCLQNTFKWDLIVYDFKFIIHSSYCLTLKLRCTQKYLL